MQFTIGASPNFSACLKNFYRTAINVNIDLDPAIADKQFHIILNGEDIHEFIYLLQLSEEVECEMEEDSAGIDSPPRITIRRKA